MVDGRRLVLVKRAGEGMPHVLMKAFLYALYLPEHPNLELEVPIGDRFKPDLVARDAVGRPTFWAEAGAVAPRKLQSLLRRFRETHIVLGKWNTALDPVEAMVRRAWRGVRREANVTLIRFPSALAERGIDEDGVVRVAFADCELRLLEPPR